MHARQAWYPALEALALERGRDVHEYTAPTARLQALHAVAPERPFARLLEQLTAAGDEQLSSRATEIAIGIWMSADPGFVV